MGLVPTGVSRLGSAEPGEKTEPRLSPTLALALANAMAHSAQLANDSGPRHLFGALESDMVCCGTRGALVSYGYSTRVSSVEGMIEQDSEEMRPGASS